MAFLTKPLLVGECNPYSIAVEYALYPYPVTASGYRLAVRILGLTPDEYLERFERVNLCSGAWDLPSARRAWARSVIARRPPVIVVLGARVASAARLDFRPFTVAEKGGNIPVAVLPHPSGRSRLWNDPDSYGRARGVLAEVGVECGGE